MSMFFTSNLTSHWAAAAGLTRKRESAERDCVVLKLAASHPPRTVAPLLQVFTVMTGEAFAGLK